jgi:menaquinone-specific isochorismate synthase
MVAEWWVLPVIVIIQTPKKRILRVMIPPNRDDAWATIETILLQWVDAVAQPEHDGAYTGVEHRPKKNEWRSTIDDVKNLFQTTKLEKVVMARESQFVFEDRINPFAMMAVIQHHGPELHHFVMRFSSDEAFIGGTPERLFEINDGGIASDAIAGTIRNDAGATGLLTRHKDASEHRYVSDFILRAMEGLCDGSITFKKKPKLLTLRVISHLMQTFKGALRPGVGPFDAMAALHPTPAVAGTPTDLAMGAIAQLEPFSRQWYAGPMGVVTASDSTVVVAIRSGLVKGASVTLFAGAGIVAESDPNSEWDELNAKISGFEALFRP